MPTTIAQSNGPARCDPIVLARRIAACLTGHKKETAGVGGRVQIYRTGPITTRLEHRAFEPDDAETFFRLNSHPDVMRYTGEPPLASVAAAKSAIESYPDFEQVGFGRWACILRESKSIIGFCGLKYLSDLDEVDIGYRFFPEFWGKGIATEAASACIEFGFNKIGLERIIGLVVPENGASIRVLEKIGLRFEREMLVDGKPALKYARQR